MPEIIVSQKTINLIADHADYIFQSDAVKVGDDQFELTLTDDLFDYIVGFAFADPNDPSLLLESFEEVVVRMLSTTH